MYANLSFPVFTCLGMNGYIFRGNNGTFFFFAPHLNGGQLVWERIYSQEANSSKIVQPFLEGFIVREANRKSQKFIPFVKMTKPWRYTHILYWHSSDDMYFILTFNCSLVSAAFI